MKHRGAGVRMLARHSKRATCAALLAVVAACTATDDPTGPAVAPSFAANGGGGELVLCKYTADPTPASFTFDVSATSGKVPGNGRFTIGSRQDMWTGPECAVVWSGDGGGVITITERSTLGWEMFEAFYTLTGTITPTGNTIEIAAPHTSEYVVVKNRPGDMDPALGRMTGGGGQTNIGDVHITRGFTIHCDITLSNNVEVNWEGNSWHIDKPLTGATCIDDPNVEPAPPPAPFDTFIGEGIGRLNNVDGSFIRFTFVDAGEPSGNGDYATIDIWAPGDDPAVDEPVLSVDGPLDHGNIQAHYDQPHGSKANN